MSDSNRPVVVPRCCLVETEIFRLEETARERSSVHRHDTPLSSERSREFDQFGSMQGEMHRDPDVFVAEVGNLVSSSQGCQS